MPIRRQRGLQLVFEPADAQLPRRELLLQNLKKSTKK
jgi:hypothetical protein